jgi:hypothetical protein
MLAALKGKFFQKSKGKKDASGGEGQATAAEDGRQEAGQHEPLLLACQVWQQGVPGR